MLKKFIICMVVLFTSAAFALGDQITFSFIGLSPSSILTASKSGLELGPVTNVLVSDANTGESFSLLGMVTGATGAASNFTVLASPNIVLASFDGAGSDSVLLENGGIDLLTGEMEDKSNLISTYPAGAGAFLSDFTVTSVSSSVLALFGLSNFASDGAISVTFGSSNIVGPDQLSAIVGGGTITITATKTPESSTVGLCGLGIVLLVGAKLKKFA